MYCTRVVVPTSLMALALAVLSGCARDPNVAKVRYLESGDKYLAKGKYNEARIMYKDALQKDQRYGPAYYKLGLTALHLNSIPEAVQALRRAMELLPASNPDHWNAGIRLSEVYLAFGRDQQQFLQETEYFCSELLQRNPNSFDGHRLTGDLNLVRAMQAFNTARPEEGRRLLATAISEYEKADSIRPGQPMILIQLARSSAASGDYARAEQLFRQVISKDKSIQAAYADLYRLLLVEKKYEEAEKVLRTAYQNNPKQYTFLIDLAAHYAASGNRQAMFQTLQEIKSHAADYPEAYLVAGDFYLRLGDADSAIREYREGAAKNPKLKSTLDKRVIEALLREGKRAEAAELNGQILKQDPNDPDAKGLAASFLLAKGDVSHALADLQAVATRAPGNPIAHFNLGRAYLANGNWEQARQSFLKALELRPDYLNARVALAQLQTARGEYEAALNSVAQVLAVDSKNTNAKLIEAAALMGIKKFDESRNLLETLAKTVPDSSEVYFQLGVLNLNERKWKEAEQAFRKSYELNPVNTRGLMGMVQSALSQNKPDAALQLLRGESAKSPNRLDLRLAYGGTAARTGHLDEALGVFQDCLKILDKDSKQRADVYLLLGEVYRRKGDLRSATESLRQARRYASDNPVILSALAQVLDSTGNWADAKEAYEAALRLRSDDGLVLNNLAYLLAEHNGDLDDALSKANRAKQLLPNLDEVTDTLGWVYLKKNLNDSAVQIFRDLVKRAPERATFRYHLAMAYSQKGDKPNAIRELQQALKNNPTPGEKTQIEELLKRLNGA